jgi:hypothetical protein
MDGCVVGKGVERRIGVWLDPIACLFLREGVLKCTVVSAISVYAETIKLENRLGSAQCVCRPL